LLTSQIISQGVFIASLGLSGMWVPIVLMPEILQNIAAFAPLTLIVEGIQKITREGVALAGLLPEIGLMAIWIIVVYGVGIKTFRWE
jgi:ABC-2 type transport system permease protein